MIFYFSATGNCKYVAERLAEALNDQACSITEYREGVYALSDYENLGVVTPTYSWELPNIVREFLQALQIRTAKENYIFSVSTYGTTPGASGAEVKHWMRKKGILMDALYSVQMPDTWTPMFDLSNPEKVAEINRKAEKSINELISKVTERKKGNFMQRNMPYPVRIVSDYFYENMRKTDHFLVEESCVGCGLCEKKCPVQAITMKNKVPVWEKEKCVMCLGCLHRCPKFAIQYGKNTKKHGQYKNPHVKRI